MAQIVRRYAMAGKINEARGGPQRAWQLRYDPTGCDATYVGLSVRR